MINKRLITIDASMNPLTLTFFHVLISCICDCYGFPFRLRIAVRMSLFHKKELNSYLKCISFKSSVRFFLPLSLSMMSAKFLTYTSYGLIPVSLTHTVKALQPFFNVVIVFLWTGDAVDLPTLLSLIPIVVGVIYASVNEVECCLSLWVMNRFVWKGFFCALCSTVVSVWQGVYLKMMMKTGLSKEFVITT